MPFGPSKLPTIALGAWRSHFKNVSTARQVFLDPDQIQLLVNACEPGLRELVAVGAQTGARLGDCAKRMSATSTPMRVP